MVTLEGAAALYIGDGKTLDALRNRHSVAYLMLTLGAANCVNPDSWRLLLISLGLHKAALWVTDPPHIIVFNAVVWEAWVTWVLDSVSIVLCRRIWDLTDNSAEGDKLRVSMQQVETDVKAILHVFVWWFCRTNNKGAILGLCRISIDFHFEYLCVYFDHS